MCLIYEIYKIYNIYIIHNILDILYTQYKIQKLDIPIQGICRLYSIYYTVGYRGSHHFTAKSL